VHRSVERGHFLGGRVIELGGFFARLLELALNLGLSGDTRSP
jgi:hypothetical protein